MRKLTAATLALTVAGGVYLSSGTAEASNMGFKLQRSFDVVRNNPADRRTNWNNIYLLSFPLFNGLGDVGQDVPPSGQNKCVGDAGSSAVPDGVIDSVDAICDLWTSRQGSFFFSHFKRDSCAYETESATAGGFGITFGNVPFALERDAGYQINVTSNQDAVVPVNRAVIVGSHDPSYTGRTIRAPNPVCHPAVDLINLPYHTMYTHINEVLCGLEGVAWVDVAPADGNPDTCPSMTAGPPATDGGIFDGQRGPTHTIQAITFDNTVGSATGNSVLSRSVTMNGITGALIFTGTDYALTPGDSYQIGIGTGQQNTIFLSPHF